MQNERRLRSALLGNGLFSSTTGLLLAVAPGLVGSWLGVSAPLILRSVGLGLVAFGAVVLQQSASRNLSGARALLITALDASWVVGSAVLLLATPSWFSASGLLLVSGAAAAVGGFAIWQLSGLARYYQQSSDDYYRVGVQVKSGAGSGPLWQVLSDISNIHRYVGSLRATRVSGGPSGRPGVGTIRHCESKAGTTWSERFIRWDEGKGFAMEWDASAADFPFPFTLLRGGWEVEPVTDGSLVRIFWEVRPKWRALVGARLAMMEARLSSEMSAAVDLMTTAAQTLGSDAAQSAGGNLRPATRTSVV